MKIIFVCGPYTASTRAGISRNIAAATRVARELARNELGFICPHLNSRHMQDIDVDPAFWCEMYLALIDSCDALLTVGQWQKSVGCQGEIAFAFKHEVPVFHSFEELFKWTGTKSRPSK